MECNKCLKTFTNHRVYFKHRSENCRPKQCPTCGKTFKSGAELYQHINHERKVSCDHCKKAFCSNDMYQRHLRSLRDITDDSMTPNIDSEDTHSINGVMCVMGSGLSPDRS